MKTSCQCRFDLRKSTVIHCRLHKAAPAMLEFIDLIARMKTADEYDNDGEEMDGDDACATLSELIVSARKVQP